MNIDNNDTNLTLFYYVYDILEVETSYLKGGNVAVKANK